MYTESLSSPSLRESSCGAELLTPHLDTKEKGREKLGPAVPIQDHFLQGPLSEALPPLHHTADPVFTVGKKLCMSLSAVRLLEAGWRVSAVLAVCVAASCGGMEGTGGTPMSGKAKVPGLSPQPGLSVWSFIGKCDALCDVVGVFFGHRDFLVRNAQP